jgi:hypothetical protein
MPNTEPTNQEILEAIQAFAGSVDQRFDTVDQRFVKIDQRFDAVDQHFENVDRRLDGMDRRFEKLDHRLDGMDMRFERIESTMATKDDLAKLEDRVITEIDRFVSLHQTLDIEIVSLRSRCERMETFMARVAKKLDLEYQSS